VLSGGQRKRVSIAVELLAHPTLFFLDEPTSGLDPGLEKKMMYDLNKLADDGRTIVLVTHATANIEQCDQVTFLAYGRLAYYGPPDDALKFYNVRDFSDIYIKLSQEIDPSKGKQPPSELKPYYPKYQRAGKVMSGVLWADHYYQSPYFKKYVADRQRKLKAGKAAIAAAAPPARRSRDSFIRQMIILARRQFDLIRLDLRTLLILLLMMPLIGALFGMVGEPDSFVGEHTYTKSGTTYTINSKDNTKEEIEEHLKRLVKGEDPEDEDKSSEGYGPVEDAQMLVIMLSLALTQGGTFAAAYEIVKERPIFRRERAVNLKVIAYIMSKVIVLGGFAVIQVAGVIIVLGLFGIDLDFGGIVFEDSAALELFVTFYIGIMTSIMFGLFISAIVPSTDVVLYAILIQLFVQIILGGALFPLDSPIASKSTVGYWTTVAVGSTVDLPGMNDKSLACYVTQEQKKDAEGNVVVDPNTFEPEIVNVEKCDSAKAEIYPGGTKDNENGDYKHDPDALIKIWSGSIAHFLVYFVLTIIIVSRQKPE
jgi:hypothetical protein